MSEMNLERDHVEGTPVWSVSGRLDSSTAPDLRPHLVEHFEEAGTDLVLDLSGLEFMDTSGLATLIETQLNFGEADARLVLFGLSPQIRDLFAPPHVGRLFNLAEGREEALEALG